MNTRTESLLALLGMPNTRFVIPAYQRRYAWKERQCRELWLDLERAARSEGSHFVGTLLYAREPDDEAGCARIAVIDGQQRLTTVTLLLTALKRHLEQTGRSCSRQEAVRRLSFAAVSTRRVRADATRAEATRHDASRSGSP